MTAMIDEPVGYLRFISHTNVKFIHNLVLKGASPIITPYPDIPVYLAPPSTEALQKDNAELFGKVEQLKLEKTELIEYAKKLNIALENICGNRCNAENNPCEARDALAIQQPKCMQEK